MEKIDRSVYIATGNGIFFLTQSGKFSDPRLDFMCLVLCLIGGVEEDGRLFYSSFWNQSHMFDLVLISFIHVRGS